MKIAVTCAIAAFLLVSRADAQAPPANAALRYWMAFAVMRDPPADKATADLLEHVSDGSEAWDEAKLGSIVDDNRQALDIMQRASTLPTCDWGLEYRARAEHADCASCEGANPRPAERRRGEAPAGSGPAFAGRRHVARGHPILAAHRGRRESDQRLVGTPGHGAEPSRDSSRGRAQRDRCGHEEANRVGASGDAGGRVRLERRDAPRRGVVRGDPAAAADSVRIQRRISGASPGAPVPADFTVPSAADIAAFHAFTERVVTALAQPLDQRMTRLREIEAGRPALHVFFRQHSPSAIPLEGSWTEIAGRRQSLLDAVTK